MATGDTYNVFVNGAETLFEATGTVSEISGRMVDISQFSDVPGSRHAVAGLEVNVYTGAGIIPLLWHGEAPKVGDRVTITVTRA